MKNIFVVMALFLSSTIVWAEDEGKCDFSVGADFVSSYVWRGILWAGTSIQPAMGLTAGGFSIGAWGSVDVAGNGFGGYKEVDLTTSYSFGNLTAGFFNYWASLEGEYNYFDYSKNTVHLLEANLSYTFDPFPLTLGWNTIIAGADHYMDKNEKSKRAFSTYVEATYVFSIKEVNLEAAVGASPWKSSTLYTSDFLRSGTDGFAVVNVALTASKDIKITDKYSLGIFGQLAFNPAKEDAFFVFGIKF